MVDTARLRQSLSLTGEWPCVLDKVLRPRETWADSLCWVMKTGNHTTLTVLTLILQRVNDALSTVPPISPPSRHAYTLSRSLSLPTPGMHPRHAALLSVRSLSTGRPRPSLDGHRAPPGSPPATCRRCWV